MKNRLLTASTRGKVMQIVEEELELTKKRISTKIKRVFKDRNQTSARKNMKLKFRNRISQKILTGEEIKAEGNTPIEMALVYDPSENIVDVGPEASANVEIVLLKGEPNASEGDDRTVENFNENIGKKPLLDGNVRLKLRRGIGVVKNIKFRHDASKIKPSVFKLAARVISASNGIRIKEAKTESFIVKDYRNKYYKKHPVPSLTDKVPRLVYIRKGGKIDKRLQDNKIYTVEDFLIRLLRDPEELRSIVNLGTKKWEATVKNARACASDRMYFYINLEQKRGVVFNVRGEVLGLYIESQYFSASKLLENRKTYAQELLASAYRNWGDIKPFDDMISLQQYFADLSTHMDALDSVKPDYPAGGLENTTTSEMVGESSSRRSTFNIDDVEVMYDAVTELASGSPFNPNTMFEDFDDEFIRQLEQSAESDNFQISNTPKRWKKLLWVSWLLIRKRMSPDVTHIRKKHKGF